MSRQRIFCSAALVVLGLTFLLAAAPQEADWKAVDDAINKGLPKTAIEKLDPIIAGRWPKRNTPKRSRRSE